MDHWLDRVALILCADSADLRDLAHLAGGDPARFYVGANLNGVDLRGQDLRGMSLPGLVGARVQIDEATKFDEEHARQLGLKASAQDMAPQSDVEIPAIDENWVPPPDAGPPMAFVDMGASKSVCFLMRPSDIDRERRTVLSAGVGYMSSPTELFRELDLPSDLNLQANALAHAVQRAELVAGVTKKVAKVTVCTSRGGLISTEIKVDVSLGVRPVTDRDLNRAIASALAGVRLPGRRPIHLTPSGWSVDHGDWLADPRDRTGSTLSIRMAVVSIEESSFRAIAHAVERAGYEFGGVLAAPYVAGLAALDDYELDQGAICIDMGALSTAAAVFTNRGLRHIEVIDQGGSLVTADIARVLMVPWIQAEQLKTGRPVRDTIDAKPWAPPEIVDISPTAIGGLGAERLKVVFEALRSQISSAGISLGELHSVTLSGGGSALPGAVSLAQSVFKLPVRIARPLRLTHLAEAANGPAFCAGAGAMLRQAFGPREVVSNEVLAGKPQTRRARGFNSLGKIAVWIRDNT